MLLSIKSHVGQPGIVEGSTSTKTDYNNKYYMELLIFEKMYTIDNKQLTVRRAKHEK